MLNYTDESCWKKYTVQRSHGHDLLTGTSSHVKSSQLRELLKGSKDRIWSS